MLLETRLLCTEVIFLNLISLNRISLREEIPGVESEDPDVKSQNKCKNEGYFWFQVTEKWTQIGIKNRGNLLVLIPNSQENLVLDKALSSNNFTKHPDFVNLLCFLAFWLKSSVVWGLPGGTVVKNLPVNARDTRGSGSIPGLGRFPWRRKWQPTPVFLHGKFHG